MYFLSSKVLLTGLKFPYNYDQTQKKWRQKLVGWCEYMPVKQNKKSYK